MALGPRIKVVFLNILPASTRNELAIILKWQVPSSDIFLVIPKKGDRARKPLVRELCKQHERYS